jgi:LysM repeat protein
MNKYIFVFLFCLTGVIRVSAQSEFTVAYIEQYKKIAIQEMKRTGIPASITLAQGILESNSGESTLAKKSNNHFGIKCKLDWKGETTFQDDDTKQECFRVYPNAKASYKDHSDFLKTRPNYAPLFQLDPVDDSAWAYGLKKAGYATASDYARKILKVIDDYELSQYNFPELDNEDSVDASTDTKKEMAITPVVLKDTVPSTNIIKTASVDNLVSNKAAMTTSVTDTLIIATDTVIAIKDTLKVVNDNIQLSRVNGIAASVSNNTVLPTMNGIGNTPKDTTSHVLFAINKKRAYNYPKDKFKINQVSVIWAKAGSSYLEIAQTHHIALYKLFEFNDLIEADIVEKDQLVFLAPKRKEGNKSVHVVKQVETLYEISQDEAIQLSYLKSYNKILSTPTLKVGTIVLLFKPKDTNQVGTLNGLSIKEDIKSLKNIFKRKK